MNPNPGPIKLGSGGINIRPTNYPLSPAPLYTPISPSIPPSKKEKSAKAKVQPKLPEDSRYAIDILTKWVKVMVDQWGQICQELFAARIENSPILEIGTFGTLNNEKREIFVKIQAERGLTTPVPLLQAIQYASFDIDKLPEIRKIIVDAFAARRSKIKEVREAAVKAEQEKDRKIREVLPAIIDEFGADLIQYGPPNVPEKPKEEDIPF
ncbi:MAG: hypothetical protein EHM36_00100 [Deltaproteobacteria bacterium]|nr:MAG: hypothetical protein EHM36_00100 [Deltaproteobacteria bacterium]